MTGTIAITDEGWYRFLSDHPQVAELNFWTPSGRRSLRAPQFSPFLFKLRAPHNAICGFAYFAQFSRLPDWLAGELPQGRLTVRVEPEATRPRIKRVTVEIGWQLDNAMPARPVVLVGLFSGRAAAQIRERP